MGLKETVFGSKSEENVYKHLESIWKDKINLYHNLPFANIIEINSIKLNNYVTSSNLVYWRKFLLMTSIDFVVCDKKNQPIMCIEFDGMTGSYNKGTEVFQDRTDKKRKDKLELKLKIAQDNGLPFYIISYPETEDLFHISNQNVTGNMNLTVVDGIIGQTMKHEFMQEKVKELVDTYRDSLDSMNESEEYEFIEDLVLQAEVELELKWDPIAIKAAMIQELLFENGIISGRGFRYLNKPELPPIKDFSDVEGLQNRIKAFEKVEWQGCEVYTNTPDGDVIKQVWIRNFDKNNASPLIIVENIAELLLFSEIAAKYDIKLE